MKLRFFIKFLLSNTSQTTYFVRGGGPAKLAAPGGPRGVGPATQAPLRLLIKIIFFFRSCSILIYYSIRFFIYLHLSLGIYFVILVKALLNRLKSLTMKDSSLGICLRFVSLIFISLACQLGYHPVDIILIRVVLAAIILVIYVLF